MSLKSLRQRGLDSTELRLVQSGPRNRVGHSLKQSRSSSEGEVGKRNGEQLMLFFVNKPEEKVLERIALVGGDEDKALLLVGDAVVLGTAHWEEKFEDMDVEDIYVAKDAVEARNIELSDNCEVVDYAKMVDLLLGSDEKVVSL